MDLVNRRIYVSIFGVLIGLIARISSSFVRTYSFYLVIPLFVIGVVFFGILFRNAANRRYGRYGTYAFFVFGLAIGILLPFG